jgi:DNA-binding LytR/AlgR family response regulator
MNCLIIDDEPLAREIIRTYLQKVQGVNVLGEFSDPVQALHFHNQHGADLFFLDINMPNLSGIELLKAMPKPPMVIFTTAYPQYALEGYDFDAIDYLLKPIAFDRFLKALQKAEFRFKKSMETSEAATFLMVKVDKKIYQVPYSEIEYIQSLGDYVKIFKKDKMLISAEVLKNLDAKLPSQSFFRCHKSYIVARSAIQYIDGNMLKLSKDSIPIGQHYREAFLQWLNARV